MSGKLYIYRLLSTIKCLYLDFRENSRCDMILDCLTYFTKRLIINYLPQNIPVISNAKL